MKIAFVCFFEEERISGPSMSMTSLAARGKGFGHECSVFTSSINCKKKFHLNGVQVNPYSDLIRGITEYDLVVMSGLFDWQIFRLALTCVWNDVDYVFSPRSNLMIQALKKGWLKKKIALLTYSGFVVNRAKYVHFLSMEEMKNSLFLKGDFFISRNGVTGLDDNFNSDYHKENLISFVGRLDIGHKGIDLLLESICLIKENFAGTDWRVELYGPVTKSVIRELNDRISRMNISDLVKIYPPITGNEKFELLKKTKIFLHPSRYEGQPQAVIEAMACGAIPVLTSGTNMACYVDRFIPCTDFNAYYYSKAILRAINVSKCSNNYNIISSYALSEFSWDLAAKEFFLNISNPNDI